MPLAWTSITAEQLPAIAAACIGDKGENALVVADYHLAQGDFAKADALLNKAAELNPALAAEAAPRWTFLKQKQPTPQPKTAERADSGKPDRAAALREATDFSPAGFDRRLGPDYAFYHKGEAEKFPNVYLAPTLLPEGKKRPYQLGGPWTKEAGDFSSTQGQVLYVSDSGFGVDRVTTLEMSNNCFSEKPEPPWWGGFRPEPVSHHWRAVSGGDLGMPVFMARGLGSWSNCGIIVFSSGFIATAGTCTGRGANPVLRLPRGKIPTAVSVTNRSEFALITVCDVEKGVGQIAVMALESSGKKTKFPHEWLGDYPCLPNVAVFTFIKLLGFVDLPDLTVPTGICAVGNANTSRLNGPDGNQCMLSNFNLSKQSDRDIFCKGGNAGFCSSTGFAVVISKHEEKVAFVDLQPLFQRTREMYFTTEENFKKTQQAGDGPKQWPYTFEDDPSWKPSVVTVVSQPRPTAVLASMTGGSKHARAYVASQDGALSVYALGGLASDEPAKAEEIKCLGSVQVGRNPVCLAYLGQSRDSFLAVSRGDRELAWVKCDEQGAHVTKRLRDARLIDPVHVLKQDTHGIETAIITVCDFRGRKILNYRFSELVFATQGGARFGLGADSKAEFEYGGFLELPGSPFCTSTANVN